MTSFIFFALMATIKAFIDTIVFRSGQSIFPEAWSPFKTYVTVPLTLGLIRLDPYHIAMYGVIFSAIAAIKTYVPVFGLWDVTIFGVIWGVFFEIPWRLFKK